jgi:hypothetical protein
MRIRTWSLLALTLLALGQFSCAAGNLVPAEESMPAARAGLLPEYRLFYDALQDYGDWTLIEPYGYVFRPYANVIGWRPYEDGYWAPSDLYGWVWISAESFGWATYHYGNWLYDRYQGWVWIPGLDWGPAWVDWQETPGYVGWSPMLPTGVSPTTIPGGPFVYAPVGQLAATDLRARLRNAQDLAGRLGVPAPVENIVVRDGVRINLGPDITRVEREAGPLARVKIEDIAATAPAVPKPASHPGREPARAPAHESAVEPARPATSPPGPATSIEAMRRAAEEGARQARALGETKAAPPHTIRVLRPVGKPAPRPHEGGARESLPDRGARADSTR